MYGTLSVSFQPEVDKIRLLIFYQETIDLTVILLPHAQRSEKSNDRPAVPRAAKLEIYNCWLGNCEQSICRILFMKANPSFEPFKVSYL